MKKAFLIGIVVVILGVLIYSFQIKKTDITFGEAFKESMGNKEITRVVVEDRQLSNKEFDLTESQLMKIIEGSEDMTIKEIKSTPMMSYEVKIYYDEDGKENVTSFVLGYNNVLQMVDGKFYKITSPNFLSEEIRKELYNVNQ